MSFVLHRQCFGVVAQAATGIAFNPHIGEEVHFDLLLTETLAVFAASTGSIEAEPPRLVTAYFGIRQPTEEFTDRIEHPRVRGRVRCGRRPQWLLIDFDDPADLLDANQFVERSRCFSLSMKMPSHRAGERFEDE